MSIDMLRREFVFGFTLLSAWPSRSLAGAARITRGGRLLTVADAIDTTRFMESAETWIDARRKDGMPGHYVNVSPDGSRYAVMLIRGDLGAGVNHAEIVVGGTATVADACDYRIAARLSTRSEGEGPSLSQASPARLTFPIYNKIRWIDAERLGFRWSRPDGVIQAVAIDAARGGIRFLTDHPTHILEWAANRAGTIVYSADVPDVPRGPTPKDDGFAVTNLDAYSLLQGRLNGADFASKSRNEIWVSIPGRAAARVSFGQSTVNLSAIARDFQLSPDGRYALAAIGVSQVPDGWDIYRGSWYGGESYATAELVREVRINPTGIVAQALTQYWLIDLTTAVARPLWNAPRSGNRTKVAWSADSQLVAIGPTYLPPDRGAGSRDGSAIAVINVADGGYALLPPPPSFVPSAIEDIIWAGADSIVIESGNSRFGFLRRGTAWVAGQAGESGSATATPSRVVVEVRQDLNTPPKLFARAVDGGEERLCLDPNPALADFHLGRVEHVTWESPVGTSWDGLLYLPATYQPGQRYPVVLQTHGRTPINEFSLYGNGFPLGPTWSAFAAQPLASRGIAVLQIQDKTIPGRSYTPEEPEMYKATFEAAIRFLARRGIADTSRIALMGQSRSGWHVEYALVHSDFPYAAAFVADNMDASYIQVTLSPHNIAEISTLVGAEPFGSGLERWLERSVGFNATRIRAPLRLQLETGGLSIVLGHWEVFSRLRQARLPVELFIIPDIEHGSHGIQNPRQCYASQQGAVEWFDFWLNGKEDSADMKSQQFERWRQLRMMRDEALRRERPPLLDWSAVAQTSEANK